MTLAGIARLLQNSPSAARAIYRSRSGIPSEWFANLSDEAWFWMNTTGRRRFSQIATIVPGMPDAALQATYTGSSGDRTLLEAFNGYLLFKCHYERHAGPLSKARVLDFGCGWGRIIRFFLRDVPPENLAGLDYNAVALEACRATNRWCRFTLINPYPPTDLPAAEWDLIYLYSVFSHLPEEMHLALLREFHRLLHPGGLLIATTRRREFIEECKSLRDDPHLQEKPDYISCGAEVFVDTDASLATYDTGAYSYDLYPQKHGRSSFWGEACISRAYVERHWTDFDILEYIDDRQVCPQNVIVARKR